MKIFNLLISILFCSVFAQSQYDICYGPEKTYTANFPALTFNANTQCWEECLSGSTCFLPAYSQTYQLKRPLICSDNEYVSLIPDDIRVSFMYNNLPCGPAWLPGLRHWEDMWDIYRKNLFFLRCDGVWDGKHFTDVWKPPFYDAIDYPINNQILMGNPPKRLVAYKLKDACSVPPIGDNGGASSLNSDCMCYSEFVLEVNGVLHPAPFLGSTGSGGTFKTPIPTLSGKKLQINMGGAVITFSEW